MNLMWRAVASCALGIYFAHLNKDNAGLKLIKVRRRLIIFAKFNFNHIFWRQFMRRCMQQHSATRSRLISLHCSTNFSEARCGPFPLSRSPLRNSELRGRQTFYFRYLFAAGSCKCHAN